MKISKCYKGFEKITSNCIAAAILTYLCISEFAPTIEEEEFMVDQDE